MSSTSFVWRLLVLAVILSTALVGCAPTAMPAAAPAAAPTSAVAPAAAAPTTAPAAAPAAKKNLVIDYASVTMDHPYWRSQVATAQALAKKAGYTLNVYDAANDAQKQVNQVDTIIAEKPDVVIFAPVDSSVGGTLVDKMKKAGIPVVGVARPTIGGQPDMMLIVDSVAVGHASGEYMLKLLKEKYGGQAKGVYLELQGDLADSNTTLFDKGFHEVMDPNKDIEAIVKPTKWDLGLASAATEDVLNSRKDVDAIFLMSDYFIPAVKSIIERQSGKVGDKNHIIVVGESADSNALDWIKAGGMDGSINMPMNDAGEMAFEYAVKLANKEPIQPGPVVKEGRPWSPAEIVKDDKGNLSLSLKPWPIDAQGANDPTLWGNLYRLQE